ncbi:MAG: acyltransferase family protein [Acidobacteriota bacterium]
MTTPETSNPSSRLVSLDALRGFDMFWIIGGEGVFHALAKWSGWSLALWASHQLHHVKWNGFVFYDMIFPLFLFIAGAAMPFSLTKRLERGENKQKLMFHVVRRGLVLVLLGIIYNNGLFRVALGEMRYPSVLGRIGLAYLLAALIVLNTRLRGQVLWFGGLLLGYWAAMMWIPVPGYGAGQLTLDGSLVAYLDRLLVPGKLYLGVHDPEGLLSTIPAISTALLGAFAGYLLRRDFPGVTRGRKALLLVGAGIACLVLGRLWGLTFPINKNLWTSSFVLYAGGWSLLLLALFYAVIDVWGKKQWSFFFVVIGMNSILIYMAGSLIDFGYTTDFFLKGLLQPLSAAAQAIFWWIGFILVEWLFLYFLYRKKLFLRV